MICLWDDLGSVATATAVGGSVEIVVVGTVIVGRRMNADGSRE